MTGNNTDNTLVRVSGVDKVFKRGSEEIHVLGGLDLEINRVYNSKSVYNANQYIDANHFSYLIKLCRS